MSLTRHLKDKQSPVRRYFDQTFPKTRGFPREIRARLTGAAMIEPPSGMGTGELGLVGTAIDYRIRYYFDANPATNKPSVALSGIRRAEVLQAFPPEQIRCYREFLESHDRYVVNLKPHRRQLERADEEELGRRCLVLALFDQLVRLGPFFDTWLERAPLDPLSIPEPEWVRDLCRMSETFYAAMSERLREPHHLNPVFEGSADVGGADADLILSRTLIDIKSAQDPTNSLKVDLYQVLGYALLDYSDQFQLEKLGLYLARYGVCIEWTLRELLDQIGAPHSLKEHREELRSLLQNLAKED